MLKDEAEITMPLYRATRSCGTPRDWM